MRGISPEPWDIRGWGGGGYEGVGWGEECPVVISSLHKMVCYKFNEMGVYYYCIIYPSHILLVYICASFVVFFYSSFFYIELNVLIGLT